MALYPRKTGLNGRLKRKKSSTPQVGEAITLTGSIRNRSVSVSGKIKSCCRHGSMIELDGPSINLLVRTFGMNVRRIMPEQELRQILAEG